MNEDDINFAIEEFSRTRDIFTQIAKESLFYADELEEQYTIKKLDLFIGLTTISVAFLTIVTPFMKDTLSVTLIITAILFLIASICGIFLSILTVKYKIKIIKEDAIRKHKIFTKFISKNVDIISNMRDYKKDRKHETFVTVDDQMEELENLRKNLYVDDEKWKHEKENEPSAILLKHLETIFWTAFSLAGLLFIIWLGQQYFIYLVHNLNNERFGRCFPLNKF